VGAELGTVGLLVGSPVVRVSARVGFGVSVLALVPDAWLEPVPGAATPDDLRAAYARFLLARVTGDRAWLPVAGAA